MRTKENWRVNTNCDTPLDFMFSGNKNPKWATPWPIIENYSDKAEYDYLDKLFKEIVDGRTNDEDFIGRPMEELTDIYKRRFPIMLGKALTKIGENILTGKIQLNVLFPGDRGFHSEER